MKSIGIGRNPSKDDQEGELVVVEHHDGWVETIIGATRELGLITHEESRRVFQEGDKVSQYRMSLDGDFSELDCEIDYYDDEPPDPVYDPDFVYGAAVAAYEAAERGELGEPESLKSHNRVQWMAALGGIVFLGIAALAALAVLGGLPGWLGG